jgi:hypothetical protein
VCCKTVLPSGRLDPPLKTEDGAVWIVFMGKFPNRVALDVVGRSLDKRRLFGSR